MTMNRRKITNSERPYIPPELDAFDQYVPGRPPRRHVFDPENQDAWISAELRVPLEGKPLVRGWGSLGATSK